ncbi:MAG: FAD-dependent oxidoreductase [Rhodobacteraceae bacterium]|nr:FAD-dependent oxidoreductase [Paracoccaceae bacterium]
MAGTLDVRVMGAGIFGLAAAHALAMRGARVEVVDPAGPGAGASGGLVGALAPHVPEAPWSAIKAFQLAALVAAGRFWERVGAVSGRPTGYGRTGRLVVLEGAQAVARAEARAEGAARFWPGWAGWRVAALATAPGAAGWGLATAGGQAVVDTLAARLAPRAAGAALVAALARAGAAMVPEARAGAAGATLWATGPAGLAALAESLGRPDSGFAVKGQAALLRPAQPLPADLPQLSVAGLFVVGHHDGTVAVGSTSERDYASAGATDAQLEALIERARASVPALAGAEVIERWAGLRPRSPSRGPVLGAWPGRAGHYVANGGFRIGFALAPLVAERMAALILDGHADIPEEFAPEAAFAGKGGGAG